MLGRGREALLIPGPHQSYPFRPLVDEDWTLDTKHIDTTLITESSPHDHSRPSQLSIIALGALSCAPALREPYPSLKPEDSFKVVGSTQPGLGDVVDTKSVGSTPSPSSVCFSAFEATWAPDPEKLATPEIFLKFTTSTEAARSLGGTYQMITARLSLNAEKKYSIELSVVERTRLRRKPNTEDDFAYCCTVAEKNCAGNAYVSELGKLRVQVTEFELVDGKLEGGQKYLAEGNLNYKKTSSRESDTVFYYQRFSALPPVDPLGARDLTVSGPSYFDIKEGNEDRSLLEILRFRSAQSDGIPNGSFRP